MAQRLYPDGTLRLDLTKDFFQDSRNLVPAATAEIVVPAWAECIRARLSQAKMRPQVLILLGSAEI